MRQIGRRRFLVGTAALLAAPRPRAQEPGRVYLIGVLGSVEYVPKPDDRLMSSLRENGFVLDRNLKVLSRHTPGREQHYSALVQELLERKVDLILTSSAAAAFAAKKATRTTPIVVYVTNPERLGLVASLARPGGNITGMSHVGADFTGKALQIVREAIPGLERLAIFHNPDNPGSALALREAQLPAAARLGLTVIPIAVRQEKDVVSAFEHARHENVGAVFCHTAMWRHRAKINELEVKFRLPVAVLIASWANEGALLSYGTDLEEIWRRVGVYVAKILNGTAPEDLPIEQPTKFELVVNLKTAKAIGLSIPQSILLRADRVIE